jgi:8-oxo-dGTP diphosphatase
MKLATLCYVQTHGKTLMIHRVKRDDDMHKGKWNGLGGKVEPGETPEECVIREVREECGLTVKNPSLKGFLTFPAFDGVDDWYVIVFVASEYEGELIESEEGVLQWVEDSKLVHLNVWEGDRVFLKWLTQKGFFSAKFVYRNGKLQDHTVVFYT